MTRQEAVDASDAIWPEFVKPEARTIRLVLIDDHPVVREGIAALLSAESDITIVGHTGDIDTGIEIARSNNPDLVICDLVLPRCPGVSAVRRFRAELPSISVLVLTALDALWSLRDAFAAGAIGYVRKNAYRMDLLLAVRAAAAGSRVICRGTLEMVSQCWLLVPHAEESRQKRLGPEDEMILRLIALGVPTRQIATALGRGMKAVGKHRAQLMRRLQLQGPAAVTQYAVGCKLVSLEEIEEHTRRKGGGLSPSLVSADQLVMRRAHPPSLLRSSAPS